MTLCGTVSASRRNLVGPAGYVSMEDGCVGGFVQRGVAAAGEEISVVNMGGEGAESQETRATPNFRVRISCCKRLAIQSRWVNQSDTGG